MKTRIWAIAVGVGLALAPAVVWAASDDDFDTEVQRLGERVASEPAFTRDMPVQRELSGAQGRPAKRLDAQDNRLDTGSDEFTAAGRAAGARLRAIEAGSTFGSYR